MRIYNFAVEKVGSMPLACIRGVPSSYLDRSTLIRGRDFSVLEVVQTGCGNFSYPVGIWGSFPGMEVVFP
jgi:hypothetical protein